MPPELTFFLAVSSGAIVFTHFRRWFPLSCILWGLYIGWALAFRPDWQGVRDLLMFLIIAPVAIVVFGLLSLIPTPRSGSKPPELF